MSDQIQLVLGSLPWKPSYESELLRVFDEYDIPLQGVILQDGCFYLFDCMAGRMTRPGLWMYSLLDSSEFAALDEAEGSELDKLVEKIWSSRPAKLAVSFRGQGLVAEADVWDMPEGLPEAADILTQRLQDWYEEIVASKSEFDELGTPWGRMASTA